MTWKVNPFTTQIEEVTGGGAAVSALVYKGTIDCSANPNYPAAESGHVYVVAVAGKIGGASGVSVEVGDMLLCKTDGTLAGAQAQRGSAWDAVQVNIAGAITVTQVQQAAVVSGVATAVGDAYSVSPAPAWTSYVNGAVIWVLLPSANSGGATLNVNALGAKDIARPKSGGYSALEANDLAFGWVCFQVYKNEEGIVEFHMLSPAFLSPSPAFSNQVAENRLAKGGATSELQTSSSVIDNGDLVTFESLIVLNNVNEGDPHIQGMVYLDTDTGNLKRSNG
jgi:hypothetical protein